MTDRSFDSWIERVIRDGKRRISRGDQALISQLLQEYAFARSRIEMELLRLERDILWSLANADMEITDAWIRRQSWYRQLDQSIDREVFRLEALLRRQTEAAIAVGIAEAGATWRATVNVAPFIRQANTPAIERWVASIQPGSPLDLVLKSYGREVDAALRREISQGIIQGLGKQSIVNEVMIGVGKAIPEYKASRIVRNEMMRTYRGVYRDHLEALRPGMIRGYRWWTNLDTRTCPACIALHNQVFDEYPDFHHILCRCDVLPVFSSRYAPPREFTTGEQWLRDQPADRQQQVLGSGERYELWRDGMPLNQMVAVEHDPVWGGSTRLKPLRDLRPAS